MCEAEGFGRQPEHGLRFRAVAMQLGAGLARQVEHRRVLAQRMDEQGVDAAIARMQHGVLEQPGAETASARALEHRDAELGQRRLGVAGHQARLVGEVRQRDELQAAVEDAEHLVAAEVERLDIALQLFVRSDIAEAQIAVALVELLQVREDAFAMPRRERADRHPGVDAPVRGASGRRPGPSTDVARGLHFGCDSRSVKTLA